MIVGDEIMLMSEAMPKPSTVSYRQRMFMFMVHVHLFGCFALAADLNLVVIPLWIACRNR
jgi:hypothetical protein